MGNFLCFARAHAHLRALMTQKSCTVGMPNATLRNHLNHLVFFVLQNDLWWKQRKLEIDNGNFKSHSSFLPKTMLFFPNKPVLFTNNIDGLWGKHAPVCTLIEHCFLSCYVMLKRCLSLRKLQWRVTQSQLVFWLIFHDVFYLLLIHGLLT